MSETFALYILVGFTKEMGPGSQETGLWYQNFTNQSPNQSFVLVIAVFVDSGYNI